MIVNTDFVEALKKDSYKWYVEEYEKVPEIFSKIAETASSSNAYEKETVATGGGRLDEKPYGGEYTQISVTEAWTPIIRMREFGNLLPIEGSTMEDIEKKAGKMVKKWVTEWAESARQTKEFMVADMLSYGGYTSGHDATFDNSDPGGAWTDSSGDFVYDGNPFFSLSGNERTAKNNDTYYNAFSTKTLNPSGVEDMYELIAETNAYKENGEKVVIMPDLLVVGTPTQEFTARRIIESEQVAGSDHNDKNVIKNIVTVVRNPFLTSAFKTAGAFVLGKAKKGIKIYSRIEPAFDFFEDKKSNVFYGRIRLRCGAGVTNWRYWASNKVPTS
jgi:hypothetical protein